MFCLRGIVKKPEAVTLDPARLCGASTSYLNTSLPRSPCFVACCCRGVFSPSRCVRQGSKNQDSASPSGTSSSSWFASPSSMLKQTDMSTKAHGTAGKFAMAEKLAEAQEKCQPLPPGVQKRAKENLPPHSKGCESDEEIAAGRAPAAPSFPAYTEPLKPAHPVRDASIESLLVRSTIESIKSSSELHTISKGAAHRGIQRLLDYNKQWAVEVSRCNPNYFADLAQEQKPEYFWIGCSDSRVPANEIVGLHPGDVFVHRNIGNIFSLSDLNCLSALQFAVDCLKVEHVVLAGHYKCGGVTAAMQGQHLGLTEHWIMQVTDIKNRWWHRVTQEIPEADHLNVLCELNVLEQLGHVVSSRVIQRRWSELNALAYGPDTQDKVHISVRDEYLKTHKVFDRVHPAATARVVSKVERPVEVEVHGWVYSLDDGMLRPLLRLTRHCSVEKAVNKAREAIFIRYSQR